MTGMQIRTPAAERDQMRKERDELRAEVERLKGDFTRMENAWRRECDELRYRSDTKKVNDALREIAKRDRLLEQAGCRHAVGGYAKNCTCGWCKAVKELSD